MLPQLRRVRKAETYISVFRGLNRSVNTGFSTVASNNSSVYTEFKDMKNLCSDDYPQLSPRKPRSRFLSDTKIISNILSVNEGLIYIDGEGNLHHNGKISEIGGIDLCNSYNMILYGNNVVILPLKKYFNLKTEEIKEIENSNTVAEFKNIAGPAEDVSVGLQMICSIRKTVLGELYSREQTIIGSKTNNDTTTVYTKGNFSSLQSPVTFTNQLRENGKIIPSVLYKAVDVEGNLPKFNEIPDYYVRIRADGIGEKFKVGDFIRISGMSDNLYDVTSLGFKQSDIDDKSYLSVLNNHYFKLYDVTDNYIVIKANLNVSVPYIGEMTLTRVMPETDFDKCIEVNNRLWTCSSKNNEIYACKQGDCTNWQAYGDGISTDSFAMTVGCEGDFTGIARQNDSVIFFKENWVLKIYGTKPSNYTLATYNVLGVEKGSAKSVVWINGILYYLSKKGVCRYSPGSQPEIISEDAFGNEKYSNAVGGRHNNKYYISAQNESGEYELFVFDTRSGLWHKEDNTHMLSAVTYNNTLYYVDGDTGYIMCPDDNNNLISSDTEFEQEGMFDWNCETGDLYDSSFDTKYISRVGIGIKCEKQTEVKVKAQFEENGEWRVLRTIRYDRKNPQMIPVAVRRSDFLRIRLEGQGKCNIYGISVEYAQGSRVR